MVTIVLGIILMIQISIVNCGLTSYMAPPHDDSILVPSAPVHPDDGLDSTRDIGFTVLGFTTAAVFWVLHRYRIRIAAYYRAIRDHVSTHPDHFRRDELVREAMFGTQPNVCIIEIPHENSVDTTSITSVDSSHPGIAVTDDSHSEASSYRTAE